MPPPADADEVARRKIAVRTEARHRREALAPDVRATASADAIARLLALPEITEAATIALYAATPDELDVTVAGMRLRERDAAILLPRVHGDRLVLVPVTGTTELRAGYRSILEPGGPADGTSSLDAIVVPGVAFDAAGRRLGRGGGHYDRLLAELPPTTHRIGACFEAQIVPEVPTGRDDQAVDVVVTERAVRRGVRSDD